MINSLRKRNYIAGVFLLSVITIGTLGYFVLGYIGNSQPLWSLTDCLYMTVITLTTVGFGEIIDIAAVPGARLFTILILLGGLGIAAYFISTLTAFLVEGELTNVFWRKRMEKDSSKLKDHIIICGIGRVGYYIIDEMVKVGASFVAIDTDVQRIKALQDRFGFFPAIVGDATHANFLEDARVTKAKGVISALSDDKDNLCVIVTCKQLKPDLHLISTCKESEFSSKLELLGAEVVLPNSIGGLRIASKMIRPRVVSYLDTLMRDKDCVVRIEDIVLTKTSNLIGKPLNSIEFDKYGPLLVLAIIRAGVQKPLYNPQRSVILDVGDTLVVQTDITSLDRFRRSHA